MSEATSMPLFLVSFIFVLFFLVFVLLVFPIWMFCECVSSAWPKKIKALGIVFIIVACPVSPLLFGMFFGRKFMVRLVSVASTLLLLGAFWLGASKWRELKAYSPNLVAVVTEVREKASILKGFDAWNDYLAELAVELPSRLTKPYAAYAVPISATGAEAAQEIAAPARPQPEPEPQELPAREETAPEPPAPVEPQTVEPQPVEPQPVEPQPVESVEETAPVPSAPEAAKAPSPDQPEVTNTFYPAGQIKTKSTMRDGVLDGQSFVFYESGKVMYVRDYEKGALQRIRKYSEDGTLEYDTENP